MARRVGDLAVALVLAACPVVGCSPMKQERLVPTPAKPATALGETFHAVLAGDREPSNYHVVKPSRTAPGFTLETAEESPVVPPDRPTELPAPAEAEVPAPSSETVANPVRPVANSEPAPDDPVIVALRCVLDKRLADAVTALDKLDKTNQDILLSLLPLLGRLAGQGLDQAKPTELTALIQQVESLETQLRKLAPPRMNELWFCHSIDGFGSYEPMREQLPTFVEARDGRPGSHVHVYAEVSNFTIEQRKDQYVAHLASSLEVREFVSGKPVWSFRYPDEPDVSRSPWRDHYIRMSFRIPPELKPGKYTLYVQVQDELAKPPRPPARRSLTFRVVAQGSVVGPKTGSGAASQ